jgi:RecJ-like exonuclease
VTTGGPSDRVPPAPGADRPGDVQAGENTCPTCAGTGRLAEGSCPTCGGTGAIIEVVGDA